MTAEEIYAILILALAVVFVLGHEAGRRQERTWTKRRLDRARRIYIGGMRDW